MRFVVENDTPEKLPVPLFSSETSRPHVEHLTLYADERKRVLDRWDYLALVFLPTNRVAALVTTLRQPRIRFGHHGEVKFSALNKKAHGAKSAVARAWMELLVNEGKHPIHGIRFKILGIDRTRLAFSAFGDGDHTKGKYPAIYNRFFRTQLIGGLRYFYRNADQIVVDAVFHDSEGQLEGHDYFSWHAIERAARQVDTVTFGTSRIEFVPSDPNDPGASPLHTELVQFTDVIVGAVTHCFDCPHLGHVGQRHAAEVLLPLLRRMVEAPANRNSSYGYHQKYDVAFFPSVGACGDGPRSGGIYRTRRLVMAEKLSKQGRLF